MQRKLKVDASSLWDEPTDQFILRFNDLSEAKQNRFAERIKKTTSYAKINSPEGPSALNIKNLIKEINPVLYAEGKRANSHSDRRWNVLNVHTLSGWYWRKLNKMIYRFLCLKKEPKYNDIYEALKLSIYGTHNPERETSFATDTERIIEPIRQQEIEERNPIRARIAPEEMGIKDVQKARERAENSMGQSTRPLNNPTNNN